MADWLTKMQQACPHPIWADDTTYYGVPMGVPVDNPEPEPGTEPWRIPSMEEVHANPSAYTMFWYYRPWCPRCKKWKEPLLAQDGKTYMDEG